MVNIFNFKLENASMEFMELLTDTNYPFVILTSMSTILCHKVYTIKPYNLHVVASELYMMLSQKWLTL